jgi:hypothetical protein
MNTFCYKGKDKDIHINYKHYKNLLDDEVYMENIIGYNIFRKHKLTKKSIIEMKKIMKELVKKIELDILLGIEVDLKQITMSMGKINTTRKSPTIKGGKLHLPIIRIKKNNTSMLTYNIPTLRYQAEIEYMIKQGVYENL